MWLIINISLLLILSDFQLTEAISREEELRENLLCYVCDGQESCSKDLSVMQTSPKLKMEYNLHLNLKMDCRIVLNLTAEGGPKVIAREVISVFWVQYKARCLCMEPLNAKNDCKIESCRCSGKLCNGQPPECSSRLDPKSCKEKWIAERMEGGINSRQVDKNYRTPECYVCEGAENCINIYMPGMKREHVQGFHLPHPHCQTVFDLSDERGAKLISRRLVGSVSSVSDEKCTCVGRGCLKEVCDCYTHLCNIEVPNCASRVDQTFCDHSGTTAGCYKCNGTDECSVDPAKMYKDVDHNDPRYNPLCEIIVDIRKDGPNVIRRRLREWTTESDNGTNSCVCDNENCSEERCVCFGHLCNRQAPDCNLRYGASSGPACKM